MFVPMMMMFFLISSAAATAASPIVVIVALVPVVMVMMVMPFFGLGVRAYDHLRCITVAYVRFEPRPERRTRISSIRVFPREVKLLS